MITQRISRACNITKRHVTDLCSHLNLPRLMAVPVPPAFDDTWAQWDDSHPPRTSKDSSQNDPEPAHVPNSPFSTELEMFQSNPWESQLDLSVGRRTYRDGATIGASSVFGNTRGI